MAIKIKKGVDLNGQRAVNASDASSATDLTTLQQVQALIMGISDLKDPVRGTSTANLAVASALVNGLSHDGVTYATGDRILLKNQTAQAENGIWIIAASGAASRATDADASTEVTTGMATTVLQGTTKGTGAAVTNPVTYVLNTTGAIVLGTTNLSFVPIGSTGAAYTAGAGLTESPAGTFNVGAGTGITVNADDVQINTSVVVRKFAADAVVTTNPQTFTHGLGTDIQVEVWETNEKVYPDITKAATSSGQVTVDWGGAPSAAQYRVVVNG